MPSGSYNFNLSINEIVEEAFEQCGLVVRNARDFRTARRSLDLLLTEWSNEGINFFLLQEGGETVAPGAQTLTLSGEVQDVVEIYSRSNADTAEQGDIMLKRVGVSDWAGITNKRQTAERPTTVWVEKTRDAVVLHLWPIPSVAVDLVWHELRRVQDTGNAAEDTMDAPYRFMPALVAGLAAKIAAKQAPDRVAMLQLAYREAWDDAQSSERERRPTKIYPAMAPYRR